MVFGLGTAGVKGCKATIELASYTYQAGELVQGQLNISAIEVMHYCCSAFPREVIRISSFAGFTVALIGFETLDWELNDSESSGVGEVKHEFMIQEVATATLCDAPVSTLSHSVFVWMTAYFSLLTQIQSTLQIGQHGFPFAFQLPPSLLGSQQAPWGINPRWRDIKSILAYAVEVTVQPTAKPKPIQPPCESTCRLAKESSVNRVKFFCWIDKGTCELMLSTERDTTNLADGQLILEASVNNATSLAIRELTVALESDLHIRIPDGAITKSEYTTPAVMHKQTIATNIAPQTKKDGVRVFIAMANVNAYAKQNNWSIREGKATLVPTCDLKFASIRYHATMRVSFNSGMVSIVKVELPVSLLNLTTN